MGEPQAVMGTCRRHAAMLVNRRSVLTTVRVCVCVCVMRTHIGCDRTQTMYGIIHHLSGNETTTKTYAGKLRTHAYDSKKTHASLRCCGASAADWIDRNGGIVWGPFRIRIPHVRASPHAR